MALTQLNYQHANDVEEEEEVQLWADESNTVVAAAAAASRQLKNLYQYYRTYGMHHSLLSQYFDLFCPTSVCILRRICVCVCVCIHIQGVSRLWSITAGGDFLGFCDQKSSYKHVSDFGRLRSYGPFLIPVHALV